MYEKEFHDRSEVRVAVQDGLEYQVSSQRSCQGEAKGKNTPDVAYLLCQECVRFLEKPDNYSVITQGKRNQMLDWKNTWPSFMWDLLSSPQNLEEDAKKAVVYDMRINETILGEGNCRN